MLWFIILMISAAALIVLIHPFLRSLQARDASLEERDYIAAQLQNLDQDFNAGAIEKERADEVRLELQRRLLAADNIAEKPTGQIASRMARQAGVVLAAAAPIAAFALYIALGNPQLEATLSHEADGPAAPAQTTDRDEELAAIQAMSDGERAAVIDNMVSGLAARLAGQPDDLEGWVMLARSYSVLGRYGDSAGAYERAASLAPDDLAIRAAHAEALLSSLNDQNEIINAQTIAALREVERLEPDHPLALYFLGLAAKQQGDVDAAFNYWSGLRAQLPPDSADAAALSAMIEQL